MPILILGTRNEKKRRELDALLAPHGLSVRSLADFPEAVEVTEDGATFAENTRKKAVEQARALGQWVLAEDSGISVDALGGAPGVYSARFAGNDATDEANNALLLTRLGDTPPERRGAHYTCHVSLADPKGNIVAHAEETCRGRIATEPRGTAGFGYDPLFLVPEYHRTFGELGETAKSLLSHRARAMRRVAPEVVRAILGEKS